MQFNFQASPSTQKQTELDTYSNRLDTYYIAAKVETCSPRPRRRNDRAMKNGLYPLKCLSGIKLRALVECEGLLNKAEAVHVCAHETKLPDAKFHPSLHR
jgi:hypothetical protein